MIYPGLTPEDQIRFRMVKTSFGGVIVPDIINAWVCDKFNTTVENIKKHSRLRIHVSPRQMCMYLLRHYTDMKFTEIARMYGLTSHATVMSSVRSIEDLVASDIEWSETIIEAYEYMRSRGFTRRFTKEYDAARRLVGLLKIKPCIECGVDVAMKKNQKYCNKMCSNQYHNRINNISSKYRKGLQESK